MFNKRKIILTMVFVIFIIIISSLYLGIERIADLSKKRLIATTHYMTVDLPDCLTNKTVMRSDLEIPIFILVRDRLNNLRDVLSSYKKLSSNWHFIICDHYSTYPPMLKYLTELKKLGVEVWHIGNQTWSDALEDIANRITFYLKERPHLSYYVVTDCDISLRGTAHDLLLFLAAILKACSRVNAVGPALQISNLPDYYNKSKEVFEHESMFWKKVPATATWDDVSYNIALQPIDTTFAMRRSTSRFARLQQFTVRTYAPYMSVHMSWYANSSNPDGDYLWYLGHQQKVNHWR